MFSIEQASIRVSVRALCEFALEGGDIVSGAQAVERMREGMRGHQTLQSAYGENLRSEVPVRLDAEVAGVLLQIFGRVDGLDEVARPMVVEEIKTTRADVAAIGPDDYPVHWAQAEIYAHIIAETRDTEDVEIRLVYYHLSGARAVFTRRRTREELRALFLSYAVPFAEWTKLLLQWYAISRPTMLGLSFPYGAYRAGQREMAANAYYALREGKNLLCQAPTGIGKTVAALYPALKALGEGRVSHIFYLTARTTARLAAEEALERMRAQGLAARSVTLTAKDKLCPTPGVACDPETCPRARGYFDRRRQALREALALERLSRAAIEELADQHALCPFELSLDLSEVADVVICDYNYAFDPGVKLKRFFLDKGDYALLVDEAHNLAPRAGEFLSAALDPEMFVQLRREAGKLLGRKHGLYQGLTKLLKELQALAEGLDEPTRLEEAPAGLDAAAEAALDCLREVPYDLPIAAQVADASFALYGYQQAAQRYDERYRTLLNKSGKYAAVKLWCYDPSRYLRECMRRVKGCVLFSATLAPLRFYRDALGLDEEAGDALLSLPSPFPSENLCAVRLGLKTQYRARSETAGAVAEAIRAMCLARPGNYLACFPSYAYLRLVREILLQSPEGIDFVSQESAMDEAAREAFLRAFVPQTERALCALVAMGGVFAEGIDLPGERLIGAAIVGVGLPQPSMEKEAVRELRDEAGEGYEIAYVYPGMERVLQAAGRVIRGEDDRGVLLLIDERFAWEPYRSLLPAHWRVRPAGGIKAARRIMEDFWKGNLC